jgi:hypothetical protein
MSEEKQEIKYLAVDEKQNKTSCWWKFAFLFLFFNLGLINNLG